MTRILSRSEILGLFDKGQIPPNVAIVSIRNHNDDKRIRLDNVKNEMIVVRFDDLEFGEEKEGCVPSEHQVKRIKEFVGKNKEKNFWVHCNAGISRSSAVAVSIEFWKTGKAKKAVGILHPMIHFPNLRIVQIACSIVDDFSLLTEVELFQNKIVHQGFDNFNF